MHANEIKVKDLANALADWAWTRRTWLEVTYAAIAAGVSLEGRRYLESIPADQARDGEKYARIALAK